MRVGLAVGVLALAWAGAGEASKKAPPPKGVSVAGYGVTFTPKAPFEAARVSAKAPDSLRVAHTGGGEAKNVLIAPGAGASRAPLKRDPQGVYRQGADGTTLALGAGTQDLAEVGKAVPGPIDRAWTIQANGYRFAWPEGYALSSTEPGSEWPFELEGPRGVMIVVRGPLRGLRQIPPPATLVAPGQKVVGEGKLGTTWIEVEYDQTGQTWRQKHVYARIGKDTVVLVTGQGPASQAGAVNRACETIVESLAP